MTQICTNSNVSLLTFVATAEAAAVRMSVITIPSTIFNSNSVNENQYKIKSTLSSKGLLQVSQLHNGHSKMFPVQNEFDIHEFQGYSSK